MIPLPDQQLDHARRLIDDGQRRKDVAALLNVDRTTLYRALAYKRWSVDSFMRCQRLKV